jgi:hypothetical protein
LRRRWLATLFVAALALPLVADAAPADVQLRGPPWRLAPSDAAQLESHLQLPARAYPIAAYARYYLGLVVHNRQLVTAYYVRFPGFRPGAHLNQTAPDEIADGGCAVIRFVYDVAMTKVLAMECNGDA